MSDETRVELIIKLTDAVGKLMSYDPTATYRIEELRSAINRLATQIAASVE